MKQQINTGYNFLRVSGFWVEDIPFPLLNLAGPFLIFRILSMLFLQTVTDSATLEEKWKEFWKIKLINILWVRKQVFAESRILFHS